MNRKLGARRLSLPVLCFMLDPRLSLSFYAPLLADVLALRLAVASLHRVSSSRRGRDLVEKSAEREEKRTEFTGDRCSCP